MVPLTRRRLEMLLAIAVLTLVTRCTPYFVSEELRGGNAEDKLYIYPPASRPWKPVRTTFRIAKECSGLPATGAYFELQQRTIVGPRTLVVRDTGKVPPTKRAFDADVDALLQRDCITAEEQATVKAKLWARMPRTFADDLLARYRFDPRLRRVDLQAGMRLRVEWAARIADVLTREENSYIHTGTSWWTIGTRPDGALAFEPAFGWGNAGKLVRETTDVIAGSVDLDAMGLASRFYRLVYPPEGFGNTRPSTDQLSHRAVLIGADDEATIDAVEERYRKDQCDRLASPSAGVCTPFAGRTIPIAEIEIELHGERTWIAIGTTLRQIVERQGRDFRASLRYLRLSRVFGSERRSVVVDDGAVLKRPDLLDLPLVKGDRLEW